MRASDLIGVDVVAADGHRLGIVTDLRCVLDGPLRGTLAQPRVSALIVSRRHTGSLLGYDRRDQQGPWLVRAVVRSLHRDMQIIPWDEVEFGDGHFTVRGRARG